jgi:hypothetical protein
METNKLLRIYIRTLIKEEYEVGSSDPVSSSAYGTDTPHINHPVNTPHNTSYNASFSSQSGGGPFQGTGIFSSALSQTGNDIANAVKQVGGAVVRAGAQAVALGWLYKNPWTAGLMSDHALDSYLNTVQNGKTGEIALQPLKQELFKKFNLQNIAAITNVAVDSAIVSKLMGSKSPRMQAFSQAYNSLLNQVKAKTPADVKNLFTSNNSVNKDTAYLHTLLFNKEIGDKSPVAGSVHKLKNYAKEILKDPTLDTEQKMFEKLKESGLDDKSSKDFSKIIFQLSRTP